MTSRLSLALITLAAAGCTRVPARTPADIPSHPIHTFPSRSELSALPPTAAKADIFPSDVVAIDAWDFDSSAPPGAAYDDSSAWGTLAAQIAAARGDTQPVRLDPALRCAAAEIARITHRIMGMPTIGFRRFAVARCGGAYATTSVLTWRWDVSASATDAELAANARPEIERDLSQVARAGDPIALGLAAAREGRELQLVAVIAHDAVRLETASRKVDANREVTLRGTLRGEAAELNAFVNQGAVGVGKCSVDKTVALPRFAVKCRLAESDDATWVELLVRKGGRLLSTSVAEVLIYAKDDAVQTYKDGVVEGESAVRSPAEFATSLLTHVNAARRAAKLPPMRLAARQTVENTRLAGTLFNAFSQHDGAQTDKIALGLLAGWEVNGLVRNGDIFLGQAAPARDAKSWLNLALGRPLARRVLFDRDAQELAVGAVVADAGSAIAAVVTSYSLYDKAGHELELEKLHERFSEARRARGLTPHIRVRETPQLGAQMALIRDAGKHPGQALEDAMHAVNATTGRPVRGWVLETTDVDAFTLPQWLLRDGPGYLAIEVTHHRAAGAAWGQLVVMLVLVDGPNTSR